MVVLALPFAYLHFRSGGITSYVFGGVLIGISFFLLNNVFGYIGNLQNWRPWLTAAAPGLIYSHVFAGRVRLAGAAAVAHAGAQGHHPVRARLARPAVAPADRSRGRPAARAAARHCRCAAPTWSWTQPDLAGAAGRAGGGRARPQITIVPMFLGTGKHAREDLPALVAGSAPRTPAGATSALQQPVGEDPRVLDLLAKIALGIA